MLILLNCVEKATQITIINPKINIKFDLKDEAEGADLPETRLRISDNKVRIYSKTVRLQEIFNRIIGDLNTIREKLIGKSISNISWTAVQDSLKTRSSDAIRHYWNQKILPLFIPNQNSWSEQDDLTLLEFIVSQDLYGQSNASTLAQSQAVIPFDELAQALGSKTSE